MDHATFTKAYQALSARKKEVLHLFLQNKKDPDIAAELTISPATVRKHIENTCKAFGLGDLENSGKILRPDLIYLFAQYMPELIGGISVPHQRKVFLSYYGSQDLERVLNQELKTALEANGYSVFIASASLRMEHNGLTKLYGELNQCDYLLLLLSTFAARSEMVIEEVRLAKTWRDHRPEGKPRILPIRVNCPISLVNHDLRGYLRGLLHHEWHSPNDTPKLLQVVLNWLASSQDHRLTTVADEGIPNPQSPSPYSLTPNHPPQPIAEPELPGGQVELASAFYVERPGIEERCYEAIAKPGALIRIKAPRQMGKTSLMARVLHQASQHGFATVPLTFQLADSKVFTDLDRFLKWFCAFISLKLQLPDQISNYWQDVIGSKVSCKSYFERYLLTTINSPLVLGLDEVDLLFQYPNVAADFLGLLRAWHEEAKNQKIWRNLRLVVVHSTEAYIPMDINQSPFNVGLPIELPEFQSQQVQDLANRHGLAWDTLTVNQLMGMVGGHPYLIRLALYHIARQEITLAKLLTTAPTDAGLYSDHLRRHLWNLSQHPELAHALKTVVMAEDSVQLESIQGFRLHSMGLVNLQGNEVTPRCDLYRQYFRLRLASVMG